LKPALESVTRDVQAHSKAVLARLADLDALAQAITDPFVARRVVIDQAVDLRRSLLDQAERTRRAMGNPGSTQPGLRRDDTHEQTTLAALEAVPKARTARAVLAAALGTSAGAARPLAEALADQPDLGDVAQRSVATCWRILLLAEQLAATVDTACERE